MKKVTAVIISILFASSVWAHEPTEPEHSGGTDSFGCHTDHSTGYYHCHNPK
jgi:hypothetical protein